MSSDEPVSKIALTPATRHRWWWRQRRDIHRWIPPDWLVGMKLERTRTRTQAEFELSSPAMVEPHQCHFNISREWGLKSSRQVALRAEGFGDRNDLASRVCTFTHSLSAWPIRCPQIFCYFCCNGRDLLECQLCSRVICRGHFDLPNWPPNVDFETSSFALLAISGDFQTNHTQ